MESLKKNWKLFILFIFIFTIIPNGLQSIFCIITDKCPTSMFGFTGITFFLFIIVEIILIALAMLIYFKSINALRIRKE